MKPRRIGNTEVSPMGFGGWAIGGPFTTPQGQPAGWGEVDDAESIAAIRGAFDSGITLFDTANVYGTGYSERILAQALGDHRDAVVLAGSVLTKAAPIRRLVRAALTELWPQASFTEAYSGEAGAVALAIARHQGAPISETTLARLRGETAGSP